MPNIRRTFPGPSRPVEPIDVDEDDDEEEDHVPHYRPGGGKQFGKAFRPPTAADSDDDSDSDDDDDDDDVQEVPAPQVVTARGSGKQLRPTGGKYLRPAPDDDDDDDEEDSEEEEEDDDVLEDDEEEPAPPPPQPVRVMNRGGGKNFLRMQPEPESEEDSEEEEEEEEPAPPPPAPAYRVMQRGGGKSLMRMQPQEEEEDDDDSEEEEEEEDEVVEEVVQPVRPVQRSGGKGMSIYSSPVGGKQLMRRADPEDEEPVTTSISRAPTGGKQLRRQESDDDEPKMPPSSSSILPPRRVEEKVVEPPPKPAKPPVAVVPPPVPVEPVKTSPPAAVTAAKDPPSSTSIAPNTKDSTAAITRAPAGGKQLRAPAKKKAAAAPAKKAITRSPAGGKQLRRPAKDSDDDEEEEEEEMDLDDDDDEEEEEEEEDDDDYEDSFVPKPAGRGRPRRGSKKIVKEEEEEAIGDDEVSSADEEQELDINNTEALIKDEEDRKQLDSLPELEREAILGERFEKLKAEQDMKKAIREAKRKESGTAGGEKAAAAAAKKRKAPAPKKPAKKAKTTTAEEDEALAKELAGRRESARDRDATGAKSKKANALAALKKERAAQKKADDSSDDSELEYDDDDSDEEYEEAAKPWQKKESLKPWQKGSAKAADGDGVDDSGEDMDVDDDDDAMPKKDMRRKADTGRGGEKDADLEDFQKVTIPRRRLARWCNEPFFEPAILECFVRLFIGEDENGEKVYRLCEIVQVKTSAKTYKFPVTDKKDKPISTNRSLQLKFGKSEREFPMSLVSDTPPTTADVQKYLATQKNLRLPNMSKRRATKLRRVQDELVNNYTYTTADIEHNLQKRKKTGKNLANMGSEQTNADIAAQGATDAVEDAERRLSEAKRALLEVNDADRVEVSDMEKSVKDAEAALAAAKRELKERLEDQQQVRSVIQDKKKRLTRREKDQNWAKVNARALETNQRVDREANKPSTDPTAQSDTPKKKEFNPYARRKVKPKILWEVGQVEEKAEEKKDSAEDARPKENVAADLTTPSLVHEKEKAAAALSESHQFAIDEEGLAQSSGLGGFMNKKTVRRNRKGLSLDDYLERKEQGTL